jgi:ABC-type polysaccharide/polyol phosphate transport system ATPase subunit
MSAPLAIQFDRVSKRYRAGRSRTLVDLIGSNIERLRGRSVDVHSAARGRIGSTLYALNEVSLDVPRGAGLGIIGRNGAGKTTLLKLISRVTWPTSGKVRVGGHVVSLIELGAGFHPELTGRENVYLGAGLFGLTRAEIDREFDAIVDFADVALLIDTPMKRYSSGLYARLGFAVAIFSRPDIVLVDEVLAVGDAAFRRRALEALRRLIAEGKTVLFISHDMWNVRRLCTDIVWMEEGRVRAFGRAGEIAEQYMNTVNIEALARQSTSLQSHRGGTGEVRFMTVDLVDAAGQPASMLTAGETLAVRAAYRAEPGVAVAVFQIAIIDVDTGIVVSTATSSSTAVDRTSGDGLIECRFPRLMLRPRQYVLRLAITDEHQLASYDQLSAGPRFAIAGGGRGVDGLVAANDDEDGLVALPYEFVGANAVVAARERW